MKRFFISSSSDRNLLEALVPWADQVVGYNCESSFNKNVRDALDVKYLINNDLVHKYILENSADLERVHYIYLSRYSKILEEILERYSYVDFRHSEKYFIIDRLFYFYINILKKSKTECLFMSNVPHTLDGVLLFLAAKFLKLETYFTQMTSMNGYVRLKKANISDGGIFCFKDVNFKPETKKSTLILASLVEYKKSIINSKAPPQNYNRVLLAFKRKRFYRNFLFSNQATFLLAFLLRSIIFKSSLNPHRALSKVDKKLWLSRSATSILYRLSFYSSDYKMLKFQKESIGNYQKLTQNFTLPEKFVFIPLQMQPEASTSPLGGIFSSHLRFIEYVRSKLPYEFKIVVKEHPYQHDIAFSMARLGRRSSDYEALNSIDGVSMAPLHYSTHEIIEGSLGVAVVTSSVGFEAACYCKPVYVAGTPWWKVDLKDGLMSDSLIEFICNLDYKISEEQSDTFLEILASKLCEGEFADMESDVLLDELVLKQMFSET